MEAKEVLYQGLIRRIGNGETTTGFQGNTTCDHSHVFLENHPNL